MSRRPDGLRPPCPDCGRADAYHSPGCRYAPVAERAMHSALQALLRQGYLSPGDVPATGARLCECDQVHVRGCPVHLARVDGVIAAVELVTGRPIRRPAEAE